MKVFYFCGTGFEPRAFLHAKKVLFYVSQALFALVILEMGISLFAQASPDQNPSIYASYPCWDATMTSNTFLR
jgi:hypothetical protein